MNTVGRYLDVIPLRFRHARNTLSTSFKTLVLPCLYSDGYYSATACARLKEIRCLLNRNANQKRQEKGIRVAQSNTYEEGIHIYLRSEHFLGHG